MDEPRVIVVDDVTDIVDEFIFYMNLVGIKTLGFGNAVDAFEALKQHETVSVVVSDVRMRHESGLQLAKRVDTHCMAVGRDVEIILMTGEMNFTDTRQPYKVYQKPVDMTILHDHIAQALRNVNAKKPI